MVSVGNLAVGGTGKTPVAAWVASHLSEAGCAPSVVVGSQGSDEARLHAIWSPGMPVLSGRDRSASVRRAREAAGATAVVLDDGFQAIGLGRDLDVVLLSADDPFPGPVLPRGPYREPPEALARADALVVTWRGDAEGAAREVARRASRFAPHTTSAGAELATSGLVPLSEWRGAAAALRPRLLERLPGPAVAVCGVARPRRFQASVSGLVDGPVELRAYADHHNFSVRDARRLRTLAAGRPLIVTEKDAVKLERLLDDLPLTHVVVERVRWVWGGEELGRRLTSLVAEAVGP